MNSRILQLILLALCSVHALKTLIDTSGEQRVSAIGTSALVLPNATELNTALGSLNILEELTALRAAVDSLQNQTAQLQAQVQTLETVNTTRGCSWEGLGCNCHLDDETTLDAAILIGSYCVDGILQWVKILDSVHLNELFVSCEASVNATLVASCDIIF